MKATVKVVPPAPDSLDVLTEVWRAVALVPEPEESCCARLMDRAGVPAQDEAKEWLTFQRGLGLVREGERGFYRVRDAPPEEVDLQTRFREGVYGVETLLDHLGDRPLDADEAFDRFEARVPNWERHHDTDWRSVWRERVRRLLDWAVLFGLAERTPEGYVASE